MTWPDAYDRQDGLEHALAESLAVRGNKPGIEELRVALERALFFFYEGYRATSESIDVRRWMDR